MSHSWCSDVQRDEAVRAAEDNRTGPLPTLAEAISRAGQLMPQEAPQEPNCTERESGLRTERVTLEVTHDLDAPLGDWIVQVIDESLGFNESVRVVDAAKLAPTANADGGSNHAAPAASGAAVTDVAEIARLREERRSITTLLGKVESLEAENKRLRESLAIYVHAHETGNSVPPHIEEQAKSLLPTGPEANG